VAPLSTFFKTLNEVGTMGFCNEARMISREGRRRVNEVQLSINRNSTLFPSKDSKNPSESNHRLQHALALHL